MISSTVYNLKHKDGLNQRVQKVTFDSLNEASDFVKTVQKNGQMIACLEEIAYFNGWIAKDKVREIGMSMAKNAYGKYLIDLANRDLEKDPVRMLVKKREK